MKTAIGLVLTLSLTCLAGTASGADDVFPKNGDFLYRTLIQKFPSKVLPLTLKVSNSTGEYTSQAVSSLKTKTQAISRDGTSADVVTVTFTDITQKKIQCLAAVERNSKRFDGYSLGPYRDRIATVFVENCRLTENSTPFSFQVQYDVVLNLDKDIAFSNMSKSETFSITENLKVENRKLFCISPIGSSGVPNYALAIYEVGDFYALGIAVQPTGTVTSTLPESVKPNENDFPIGISNSHDIDSLTYEVLPTLEFYQKLNGNFQMVFSKRDCIEQGFEDGWPTLFCESSVPRDYIRSDAKKLSFQFSKRIITSRVDGQIVETSTFDGTVDFTSTIPGPTGRDRIFRNSLLFQGAMGKNSEIGCQWR